MARPAYPAGDRRLKHPKGELHGLLRLLGSIDPTYRASSDRVNRRQIRQNVDAQVTPVLGQIRGEIGRRSHAGMGAIEGYTKSLAGVYDKGIADVAASNDRQRADETAANTALTQFLQGRGQDASAELATKFQAAGLEPPPGGGPAPMPPAAGVPDPAAANPALDKRGPLPPVEATPGPPPPDPSRLSAMPAALGHGVGGESAARGFSSLDRTSREGDSMRSLAALMPGIAGLGGAEAGKALQLQLNREQADRLGAVTSQVPGMVENLTNQQRDRELAKAGARTALRGSRAEIGGSVLDRDLQRAIAAQGYGADRAQFQEGQQQFDVTAQNYADRTGVMALKAVTNATPAASKRRVDAYNKTLGELDNLFQPPTNPLTGEPVTGWNGPNPDDVYAQAQARLRARLPQAPPNVIDQLAGQVMAANGIDGYGAAPSQPRRTKATARKEAGVKGGPKKPKKKKR